MNKQSAKRNLWQRHWKWFTPLVIVMITVFMMSPIGNSITDIAMAYSDASIYEDAFEKAKLNSRVMDVFGNLEPINKFAIAEGFVEYSNNNTKIKITVRIKGAKTKGKLDIVANKVNGTWEYQAIAIRIKEPKETIVVLE